MNNTNKDQEQPNKQKEVPGLPEERPKQSEKPEVTPFPEENPSTPENPEVKPGYEPLTPLRPNEPTPGK